MTTKHLLCTLATATVLLPATAALAQQEVTTPGPQGGASGPAPDAWRVVVNPYASHTFDGDIEDSDSSLAVSRVGTDVNFRTALSREWGLNLGLAGEYSNYSFDGPGADLTLDLVAIRLAPGLEYRLSDEWAIFGGGIVDVAGDTSADIGESAGYGGFVGARHKVSDRLSYSFGVSGRTRLEDDPSFFPILGIDWEITRGLTLSTSGAGAGGQIRLTQALSDQWAVSAVVGYEQREFRLDDKPIADGVFRDSRVPVGVELAWRPTDAFSARLTAGYVVWQEIEFDDADGDEVSEDDVDPAPYVGISANWQF